MIPGGKQGTGVQAIRDINYKYKIDRVRLRIV